MTVKLWKLCFIRLVKGFKHYSLYSASLSLNSKTRVRMKRVAGADQPREHGQKTSHRDSCRIA